MEGDGIRDTEYTHTWYEELNQKMSIFSLREYKDLHGNVAAPEFDPVPSMVAFLRLKLLDTTLLVAFLQSTGNRVYVR